MHEITVAVPNAWFPNFSEHWWLWAIGIGLLVLSRRALRVSSGESGLLDRWFESDGSGDGGD